MTPKDKDNVLSIVVALLTILAVVMSQYPELVPLLLYRAQLWIAYRNTVNYDRLEYMRNNRDVLFPDDMKASE